MDIKKKEFNHPCLEHSEHKGKIMADYKLVYCDECKGTGSVIVDVLRGSSNLDAMFAEDPEFEHEFKHTDKYHKQCPACNGTGHLEEVVWNSLPNWILKEIDVWYECEREHFAEVAAERRAFGG